MGRSGIGMWGWIGIVGGTAALATLATGVVATGGRVDELDDWFLGILGHVVKTEAGTAGYSAMNLNSDNAGLSWGLIQWAQKPGSLGRLLGFMYTQDPNRFAATFGPAWKELIRVTQAGSLDPVAGAVLWQEPWVSRFRAAGNDPVWQEAQRNYAKQDVYWKAAKDAANILLVYTQRGLALTYDTAVNQGPGAAVSFAKRVATAIGPEASYRSRLEAYAQVAASSLRRTTVPTTPHKSAPRIVWKQVGPNEWHATAGVFDLWKGVTARKKRILADPTFTDTLPSGNVAT